MSDPVTRNQAVEYIMYTILHEEDINDFDTLKTLYMDKDIVINRDFFRDTLYLIANYYEIEKIYNNEKHMDRFTEMIKWSLATNKSETFVNFPDRGYFLNFYDCYIRLINHLLT